MADPKYANLCGIAYDQPDVYETNDLPEVDQVVNIFEEKSDSVEQFSINGLEAFDAFRGKEADATTVDFSGTRKTRIGVSGIRSRNWELGASGERETKEQRYTRLMLEIENFINDVSFFSENKETSLSELSNSLNVSNNEAHNLLSKISDLKLTDKTGDHCLRSSPEYETVQFAKLVDHLNALREKLENEEVHHEASNKLDTCVEDGVHILLKLKPNLRIALMARLSELERKINNLENLVGSTTGATIRLCNTNIDDGLINCCQWMVSKLSLLDTNQLDIMDSRMGTLNSRLDQIMSNRLSGNHDVEKDGKINELYELSDVMKRKFELVSNVVQRMMALKSLHRQGKHSLQTISYLEKLQAELAFNLTNNQIKLENMKKSMNLNVETIKSDIESLKKRITDLKTK